MNEHYFHQFPWRTEEVRVFIKDDCQEKMMTLLKADCFSDMYQIRSEVNAMNLKRYCCWQLVTVGVEAAVGIFIIFLSMSVFQQCVNQRHFTWWAMCHAYILQMLIWRRNNMLQLYLFGSGIVQLHCVSFCQRYFEIKIIKNNEVGESEPELTFDLTLIS